MANKVTPNAQGLSGRGFRATYSARYSSLLAGLILPEAALNHEGVQVRQTVPVLIGNGFQVLQQAARGSYPQSRGL